MMAKDEKNRYISYLVGKVNEADLDKRAMEAVLQDFLATQKNLQ